MSKPLERSGVYTRNLAIQLKRHGGDGEAAAALFQGDLGRRLQAIGRKPGFAEYQRQRHGEAGGMGCTQHWAQNGFVTTDLDLLLKQHGIQKIIVVGLIANSCIEATARYGIELGCHVSLVPDATAAFSPAGMPAAAENGPMFAHAILSTSELLERLPAA